MIVNNIINTKLVLNNSECLFRVSKDLSSSKGLSRYIIMNKKSEIGEKVYNKQTSCHKSLAQKKIRINKMAKIYK